MNIGIKCPPPIAKGAARPRFKRIINLQCPPPARRDGLALLAEYDRGLVSAYQRLGLCANAAKPAPLRDWDNLDSMFPRWERDAFEDSLINDPDVLHRDAFSVAEHLDAFDLVESMHHWARRHNPGFPTERGLYLFSADMGEGKSLSMSAVAASWWAYRAAPVFTNMSLRFGYRISGAGIYSCMETAPAGSLIILDEIAALMDSFSFSATRTRSVTQMMTSFRKKQLLVLAGSAAESSILSEIRRNAVCIIRPEKMIPPDGAVYPPFCYVRHRALEEPWAGSRVVTDALRLQFTRGKDKKAENPYANKWVGYRNPPPGLMNIAARASDTLDRVPAGDSFDISRDAMMAERQRIRAGGVAPELADETPAMSVRELQAQPTAAGFLSWWLPSQSFKPKGAAMTWAEIKAAAAALGVDVKVADLKAELEARGVRAPKRGPAVADLWQWLNAGGGAAA